MNSLSKKILSTVIYYDILDYPLTAFEVWKYLSADGENENQTELITLGQVTRELDGKELKEKIESLHGFYFLRGKGELVITRLEKNKISEQKFKIIKRVVFWLRFVPYIRLIAVTGTVAMKNGGKKSDLDLLIVLKHGRIFLGRTLVTGLVHLMGKRRYGKKIANRICLNCFLTERSLVSRLQDVFSASEYFFAVPIFGQKYFTEFQKENDWITKFKTNFSVDDTANLKIFPESGWAISVRSWLEKIFDLSVFNLLEKKLATWQLGRIARDPRTKEPGSIIMADAEALIFFHHAHSLIMDRSLQKKLNDGIFD